jgi:transcriptional regulator of acetoin/glycerol metabolism
MGLDGIHCGSQLHRIRAEWTTLSTLSVLFRCSDGVAGEHDAFSIHIIANSGNALKTSEALGMSERTLYRRLRKHALTHG